MTKAANLAASANATLGNVTATTIQSNSASTPTVFQDSAGTQIGTLCRAWVNFNGTTSPGTIRASFNVTSVTKGGTGVYTVNLTNALTDANYSGVIGVDDTLKPGVNSGATASAFGVTARNNSNTLADSTTVTVAIFR